MRARKARSGRRAGLPCPRRGLAYEELSPGTGRGKLTALLHHVNVDVLRAGFLSLRRDAAPGVDGLTWERYAEDLEANLAGPPRARSRRARTGRCPPAARYIPKADGRQRPLGIAALEDKIVQAAVVMLLTPIYEAEFLGFSYGFRPGRGQHDALDALAVGIGRQRINWILDADIRSFLDAATHCTPVHAGCSKSPGCGSKPLT